MLVLLALKIRNVQVRVCIWCKRRESENVYSSTSTELLIELKYFGKFVNDAFVIRCTEWYSIFVIHKISFILSNFSSLHCDYRLSRKKNLKFMTYILPFILCPFKKLIITIFYNSIIIWSSLINSWKYNSWGKIIQNDNVAITEWNCGDHRLSEKQRDYNVTSFHQFY